MVLRPSILFFIFLVGFGSPRVWGDDHAQEVLKLLNVDKMKQEAIAYWAGSSDFDKIKMGSPKILVEQFMKSIFKDLSNEVSVIKLKSVIAYREGIVPVKAETERVLGIYFKTDRTPMIFYDSGYYLHDCGGGQPEFDLFIEGVLSFTQAPPILLVRESKVNLGCVGVGSEHRQSLKFYDTSNNFQEVLSIPADADSEDGSAKNNIVERIRFHFYPPRSDNGMGFWDSVSLKGSPLAIVKVEKGYIQWDSSSRHLKVGSYK